MLILASQSQTRKSLLASSGLAFTSVPATLDERAVETEAQARGVSAAEIAVVLARAKANVVAQLHPEALVIGADQTLGLDGALLHKPDDLIAARAQLDRLAGRTHRLSTGLALQRGKALLWSHLETADLTMRRFSWRERDAVLDLEGEAVLASVGGYRLEGPSIRLFEAISGDYFAILGLSLLPLLAALRQYGPDLFPESEAR